MQNQIFRDRFVNLCCSERAEEGPKLIGQDNDLLFLHAPACECLTAHQYNNVMQAHMTRHKSLF